MNEPGLIRKILEECKSIAVVGLSNREGRASLGEPAYPTLAAALAAVPEIRLVDVFRAPEYVPAIVDEVIRLRIPYLWLQEGVIHEEAARREPLAAGHPFSPVEPVGPPCSGDPHRLADPAPQGVTGAGQGAAAD